MKNKRIIIYSTTASPADKFSEKLCQAFRDAVNSMEDFLKQADEIIALLEKAMSYPHSGFNSKINQVINKILKKNRPELFKAINKEYNNNLNKMENYLCNNPLTEDECKTVSMVRNNLRKDNFDIVGREYSGQVKYSLLGKLNAAFDEGTWSTKNNLLKDSKKLAKKLKESLNNKISKLDKIIEKRC